MELFWLLVVIIIVVVASRSNKNKNGSINLNSKDYAQGYWDGYRAHQNEVAAGSKAQSTHKPDMVAQGGGVDLGGLENDVSGPPLPDKKVNTGSYSMASSVDTRHAEMVTVNTAELKAKRDLQNINTTLYVASFLLVAAASLFIGVGALPDSFKFFGVWFVTIGFYMAGLILHKKVSKLKPAAVAFVGTGLALLPVTGIAMYSFVLPNAPLCWFITSVIGLASFAYAAIRLDNQVISYLAIAFAASMSLSSVAVLNAGLIWYFVSLILFGCVMTFLAKLKMNIIPKCFSKPVSDSNNWIVPLTIVASLFSMNNLQVRDYWIIALMSAIYYGAVAVSSQSNREIPILIARLLSSLAVLLMAYDFSSSSWVAVGLAMSFVGVAQVVVSTIFLPKRVSGDQNNEIWLWLGLAMQLIAPLFILSDTGWYNIVSAQLAVLLLVSSAVCFVLRRVIVSIFSTISLALLPIVVCLYMVQPALEMQWLSLILLLFVGPVLLLRSVKQLVNTSPSIKPFLTANAAFFIAEALAFTANVPSAWGAGLWLLAVLFVNVIMAQENKPWISLIGNGMFLVGVIRYIEPYFDHNLIATMFIIIAALCLALCVISKFEEMSPPYKSFLLLNFGLFIIEALAFTGTVGPVWAFWLWIIAATLVYCLMIIEHIPWLSIISNILILISVIRFVEPYNAAYWISLAFLVLASITVIIRTFVGHLSKLHPVLVANFILFLIESLFYTWSIQPEWGFPIWLIASALAYCMVYLEKQPVATVLANFLFIIASFWFVNLVKIDEIWKFTVMSWIAFSAFYTAYWLMVASSKRNYGKYFWWSAVITGGVVSLFGLLDADESIIIASGYSLVAVSAAVGVEGWRIKQFEYIDVAAIAATLGLQRVLYTIAPDTNLLVYTHWWSLVFAALGYMYFAAGKRADAKVLAYVSLGFVTLFSGLSALGSFGASDIPYQLIFIIEHALILVLGMILSKKTITIWGAVCVILAVLWMIKEFTFLLLAIVAVAMIAAAIYALVKQSKSNVGS